MQQVIRTLRSGRVSTAAAGAPHPERRAQRRRVNPVADSLPFGLNSAELGPRWRDQAGRMGQENMAIEKRRSDRLLLTIPLAIHQTEPSGATSSEEARTVAVNRDGARIQVARPLRVGRTVRIVNQLSKRSADFRVVGPVAPPSEKGGEYGVECVENKDNIWGIRFPPVAPGDSPTSKALLECRTCHTVALLPLSLVEVEVLDTAGIISRQCQSCATASPWGYAEKQLTMGAPPDEAAMLEGAKAQVEATEGPDRRRNRRICLQLPVLVRDYYGGVEITRSENVSKGGFCFASDKNYFMGQGIMVTCPYNSASSNIEMQARIVRRHQIEGLQRKLYGVRYKPQEGAVHRGER